MSTEVSEGDIIDKKMDNIESVETVSSIKKVSVEIDNKSTDNVQSNQIEKQIEKQSDKQLEIKSDVNSNLNSINDIKSVDDNDHNDVTSTTANKSELLTETTNTDKSSISPTSTTNNATTSNVDLDTDEIYIVEALLKSKVRKVKGQESKLYLVKWKGYSSKYNTWEPAENILDNRLIEAFEEQEKAKPPKTPRQTKAKQQEETPETKPSKPAGRKPPMNRESIVPTPSRRSRRSTKSSDDTRDDVKDDDKEEMEVETNVDAKNEKKIESNGTDKPNLETAQNELVNNDQIKNDNQKSAAVDTTTPEKLSTNSQDKSTIEKVVSLTDKLLTPEKSPETNLDEHQTNGQNSKLTIDNDIQIDKLDVCLNGESVKRKSNETDSDLEPSKKIMKTSDDLVKGSNGLSIKISK